MSTNIPLLKLEALLKDQEIADILLVWSGFKPTALIEVTYLPTTFLSRREFHVLLTELEKILQQFGLQYDLNINNPRSNQELTQYSYIARNDIMLEEIKKADSEPDLVQRKLRLGPLLGYPESAVKAFAEGTSIENRTLPLNIQESNEFCFLNFRLSLNWKEEFKYVQRRAEEIKRISPDLYNKIIGEIRA